MVGFPGAAGRLLAAAVTAWFLAVDAEGKPLEEVAEPLSETSGEGEAATRERRGARATATVRLPALPRRAPEE
jgi:hypothetical protein